MEYLLNNRVCAVIVTFNRLKLLKRCLDTIFNQSININHIVIINNNSTDGTTEYLNNLNNKKLIINNLKKNCGGAAGFSLGVEIAYRQTDDDFVWIMDDDTFPNENAVEELLKSSKILNGNHGFLCSNVRWKDGSMTNIPQVSDDWGDKIKDGLIKVDTATFVSVFIPRKIIGSLGVPTADLFIWGDDTEYTTRISSMYPSYFVINSNVLHYTTRNLSDTTIVNDSVDRIPRYSFMFRNLIYIDKKYASKKRAIRRFLGELFLIFPIIIHSKDHRFLRIYSVIKGVLKGIFFNPRIKFVSK